MLDHPSPGVRIWTAFICRTLAPERARSVLEVITRSRAMIECMEAKDTLAFIDGTLIPRGERDELPPPGAP